MKSQTLSVNKKIIIPLLLLPVWFLIYHFLKPASDWLIDDVFSMNAGSHLTEALRFFVFEVPKVLLLLTLIIVEHLQIALVYRSHALDRLSYKSNTVEHEEYDACQDDCDDKDDCRPNSDFDGFRG